MALDQISLPIITPLFSGAEILCLGYPEIAGVDSLELMRAAGAKRIDVVDVIAHRGFETILDLNDPAEFERRYDLVINPGTLEHCFNIGQAWKNSWAAVKVGGRILHVCPATMLNHGFWNVSPVAMTDWCAYNGGKVKVMLYAVNGTTKLVEPKQIPNSASGRGYLPPDTVLYALLRKMQDVPFTWPVQGVYRR